MHHRHVLTALLAALGVSGTASAAAGDGVDFRDARYCEVFALHGAVPNARAVVWNTIGRNDCPAGRWAAMDPAALAEELGATTVLLNGPRHFLMDRASAEVGEQRTIGGLGMTQVASIPLRRATDLDRVLYGDRTIARRNTWSWDRGRRVFELVAPGGDVYVMQSYAQIVDPDLTLADLGGLGARLDLPPGWRLRSRTLRKPLDLVARGAATILQDDLQNTYQLAVAARRGGARKRRALHLDGRTKNVASEQPGAVEDRGTFTSRPLGRGTLSLTGAFADGALDATFRLLTDEGSILGRARLPFTIADGEIDFRGTGRIVGGTGAYRGITGGALQIHDHNTLDGQKGVVEVDGFVTY